MHVVRFLWGGVSWDRSSLINLDCQGSWEILQHLPLQPWTIGTQHHACFSMGAADGTQVHVLAGRHFSSWSLFCLLRWNFLYGSKPFVSMNPHDCVLPHWLTSARGPLVAETVHPLDGSKYPPWCVDIITAAQQQVTKWILCFKLPRGSLCLCSFSGVEAPSVWF